ncbi:MAG: helix-turn-helix domain-containing protein [Candidatus Thiodiazotropha sp. (ex Lucina aurantia)]|nr:helix-turn-helix domain-containing protein [Candidatus Thiodiazotropha taylori]MBV2098756.1 helix-turn-helix domain-containing protein [Candidatus Thiodiazotropha sp. (ex Codakia orbicularis)]MBV2103668.1 helix-turn-helix domain-containing protein [Candidatus Thiodiazotropha sp. (ex Lucina aurantia)]MBV2118107.1 helix-turn-helix domain-containing protein [Candidatus Thiodiazotropha sp. (ex Lucina aurantia)]
MTRKHTTPTQKSKIISLRLAGYSLSTIAERCGVSISTVKRAVKGIKKGTVKQELVDQAKKDLLTNLADETVKTQLSALIADDITLSHRIRTSILATLEQIEKQTPSDAREAAQIMRSLTSAATALKATGDALRQSLGVTQREIHTTSGEDLPILKIVDMTTNEINQIRNEAEARSMGLDDGMEGILTNEDDNEVITEGMDEPEAA